MAPRTSSFDAVVLHGREGPSGIRIVTLLSPEAGLVDAFVFGGGKSKLRSLASPWNAGRAWIYRDSARELVKLTDFDETESFPGIREDLRRIWTASFAAECLMRTDSGGGEHAAGYALFIDALSALREAEGDRVDYAAVQFAWRLAALLGVKPDTRECARCGRAFAPGEALRLSSEEGFLCAPCAEASGREGGLARAPELGAGAARYLESTEALPFREALRAGVEARSLAALKLVAFELAAAACEGPLRSVQSGSGIL